MRILFPPLADEVRELCASATRELTIVSPWIKESALDYVLGENKAEKLQISVLMRGDVRHFLESASDIAAVEHLMNRGAEIRLISNIHAKVYIADHARAIIASGNLTTSGLQENIEVGVSTEDATTITQLIETIREWLDKGVLADEEWLAAMKYELDLRGEEYRKLLEEEKQLYQADPELKAPAIKPPRPRQTIQRARATKVIPAIQAGQWEEQIRQWRRIQDMPELADQFIKFFHLAFDHLPQKTFRNAWFGVHDRRISLVLGGILLAIVNFSGGRTIELLVDIPNLTLDRYLPAKSTLKYEPLGYAICGWDNAIELNAAASIWDAYARAAKKIWRSPVANRSNPQRMKGKQRLTEISSSAQVLGGN